MASSTVPPPGGVPLASLRQLEERQVEPEVKMMRWSPKMDILALALATGDVAVYRLNWQKVRVTSFPTLTVKCDCHLIHTKNKLSHF